MARPKKLDGNALIGDLTKSFLSGNTEDTVDVVTFAEAQWGLQIKLFPVQKFILKSFYGMPLGNERTIDVPDVVNDKVLYHFSEQEFLTWLYEEGRCNQKETEGRSFRELDLVLGRRGTKSTIAAIIGNYELYRLVKRGDPSAYFRLTPDTVISLTNVAPTDEQASVVFEATQNMAVRCPFLRDRVLNQTQSYFNIQTDSDISKSSRRKKASIVCVAGGCSSNSLRGRNNFIVIMDEFAFFIDNGGRFSGREVYNALIPSTLDFASPSTGAVEGKVVCASSPYAKYGAFWDRYVQSFEEKHSLMFRMYTAMANSRADSSFLRAERRKNKTSFMCEYGGEFSDSITAWIEDEAEFKACVTDRKTPHRGIGGTHYFMGIDLGVKNDGTAVAIVHRDKPTKKIVLDYADVWFSGSSDIWDVEHNNIYLDCNEYAHNELLRLSDIVDKIEVLSREYPIKEGWFDQWNGYGLFEQLENKGMKQFKMENVTDSMNSKIYQLLKMLYMEKMISLYDHPVLVPEMLSLEAEKKSKNKIMVRAVNKAGAHDDISDAFARAVWAAYNSDSSRIDNIALLVSGGRSIEPGSSSGIPSMSAHKLMKTKMHGTSSSRNKSAMFSKRR